MTVDFRALPPFANVLQDHALSQDDYKRHLQTVCRQFPEYRIDILDMSTDVNARSGSGARFLYGEEYWDAGWTRACALEHFDFRGAGG